RMPELIKLLPNCTLRVSNLRTMDLIERVRDGRLDFAIVRADAVPESLRKRACHKLTRAGYVLATPMPLARAARLPEKPKPADLARLPLALQASGGNFHLLVQRAFAESGTR